MRAKIGDVRHRDGEHDLWQAAVQPGDDPDGQQDARDREHARRRPACSTVSTLPPTAAGEGADRAADGEAHRRPTTTPTTRLTRAPYRIRLNSSRPCLSVPIEVRPGSAAGDGADRSLERAVRGDDRGEDGRRGRRRVMIARPSIAGRLRRSRRSASRHRPRLARARHAPVRGGRGRWPSGVPDPRVEERRRGRPPAGSR